MYTESEIQIKPTTNIDEGKYRILIRVNLIYLWAYDTIFKLFLTVFIIIIIWLHLEAYRILVPQLGTESMPLQWKHAIITARQPGKSWPMICT